VGDGSEAMSPAKGALHELNQMVNVMVNHLVKCKRVARHAKSVAPCHSASAHPPQTVSSAVTVVDLT